jgi:hypothetical protein
MRAASSRDVYPRSSTGGAATTAAEYVERRVAPAFSPFIGPLDQAASRIRAARIYCNVLRPQADRCSSCSANTIHAVAQLRARAATSVVQWSGTLWPRRWQLSESTAW